MSVTKAAKRMLKTETGQESDMKALGFWIYLMTDCILFASLFATFIILRGGTHGAAMTHEAFDMPLVLGETMLLLTSSFTCGLAVVAMGQAKKRLVIALLGVTFLFGAGFLAIELSEFAHLISEGHSWQTSAFLSAFFTLVGTHGLHISIGLLWIGVMIWQIVRRGFSVGVVRRLVLFSLFWHFLDVIWIFIFTIVYLIGAV